MINFITYTEKEWKIIRKRIEDYIIKNRISGNSKKNKIEPLETHINYKYGTFEYYNELALIKKKNNINIDNILFELKHNHDNKKLLNELLNIRDTIITCKEEKMECKDKDEDEDDDNDIEEDIIIEFDEKRNTTVEYNDRHMLYEIKKPKKYSRDEHFEKKIKQKLALSNQSIDPNDIEIIKSEFKEEKINDIRKIEYSDIRKILKKVGLSKYYDMDYKIYEIITGIKVLEFENALINRLKGMFDQVEKSFKKIRGKRSNMFVYDYILHKLLEILGYHVYKKHFKVPKNTEKIREYDRLWSKICKDTNWQFYPTI